MKYIYILFLLSIACQKQEIERPTSQYTLVVEAYIFENKPVEHIKLSFTKPIDSTHLSFPVLDANVSIIWNNIAYPLYDTNRTGLYSSSTNDLKIIASNTYQLYIQYEEQEYTAETTVPESPKQLSTKKNTLDINSSSDFIEATWENKDSLWFLGTIKLENPASSTPLFNNFFSIPTKSSSLKILPSNVQSIGEKEFILYGVTDDYEKFYAVIGSSTGATTIGNLENGLGIFSAFSSDTIRIIVK